MEVGKRRNPDGEDRQYDHGPGEKFGAQIYFFYQGSHGFILYRPLVKRLARYLGRPALMIFSPAF